MKFFELHFFLFFSSSAAGFLALFVRPPALAAVRPSVGPSECPYVQPSALLSVGLSARPLARLSSRPPARPSLVSSAWVVDDECGSWILNVSHGSAIWNMEK